MVRIGARQRNGESISVSLDELHHDNVADWLAYALYAMPLRKLPAASVKEVESGVELLEARLSAELEAVSYTHLTLPTICSV